MNNGKPTFALRHVIFLLGLAASTGSWIAMVKVHGGEIAELRASTALDHDTVIIVQQGVQDIRTDVDEIKLEQREQRDLLTNIYIEVKRQNGDE